MNMNSKIIELVHNYYWDMDINCARTMLLSLSKLTNVTLNSQTIDAAIGLHGAGGYRAQCGLVEGALMFLGIYASQKGYFDSEIAYLCYQYADEFTKHFSSIRCYDLRPSGFSENDAPHACEDLTVRAILFTYDFIKKKIK